jgi:hypothetical protein
MLNAIRNLFRPNRVYLWNWVEGEWGHCIAKTPAQAIQIATQKQRPGRTLDRTTLKESNTEEIAYIRKAYSVWYSEEVVS